MDPTFTKSVFLVDDDQDDRFIIEHVFKQYSPECSLHFIPDGEELLRALADLTVFPRLILLDLNMPFMGGIDALRLIRQEPRFDTIPIVILSTSNQPVDQQRAARLNVAGFISKPNTIEGFEKIMRQLSQDWLADTV